MEAAEHRLRRRRAAPRPTAPRSTKPRRAATACVEQRRRARRHRRAPSAVVEGDEVTVAGVDDQRPRLLADEHAAEVVPRRRGRSGCSRRSRRAARRRRRTGRGPARRGPGTAASRTAAAGSRTAPRRRRSTLGAARRDQRAAVDARPAAPDGLEADARWPGRRPPRPGRRRRRRRRGWWRTTGRPRLALVVPSTGSRTTTTARSPSWTPGLLAHHAEAGPVEHRERGPSAARSLWYWPGRVPADPQSARPSRAARTARGRVVEHPEQRGVVHRRAPYGPIGRVGRRVGRGRLGAVAVIDVAGFVADLKDHAVDHGFHVHDERHFVETYSLRQAWEVDLHPEEACGGPLDLHLSLEVDPRTLLSFEDLIVELPEDEEPPDSFHFPLAVHLVAAAAARRARPAAARHRAGRRRRGRPAARGVGHRLVPVGHRPLRAQPHHRRPRRGVAGRGSSPARSSSATSSTAAPTSATTCSTGRRPGSARTSSLCVCTVLLRLSPGGALAGAAGCGAGRVRRAGLGPAGRHWHGPAAGLSAAGPTGGRHLARRRPSPTRRRRPAERRPPR